MVTRFLRVLPYVLFCLFGILLMGGVYLADHPKRDDYPVFVYVTATPANPVTAETPTPTIEVLESATPSAGVGITLSPSPAPTSLSPTPTPAVIAPPSTPPPTPAPTCVHQGQGIGKQVGLCRQQGF